MSDIPRHLQLRSRFQSPELMPDGARVFELISGRILLHAWEDARVWDPVAGRLVYKTNFEGSMIYPQVDGEVYFRNRRGSGWFEHGGSLKQPMRDVMMAMCGRGDRLFVWGAPHGHPYGFHELEKDGLRHVRMLAQAENDDHTAHSLVLSGDGRRILRLGHNPAGGFGADLWDVGSGAVITTYAEEMGSEESPKVLGVKYTTSIGPEQSQVWDNATGEVVYRLEEELFHHTLHLSPSEQHLFAISDEQGMEVHDIPAGKLVASWVPEVPVSTARFTRDGLWTLQADGTLTHYGLASLPFQ